MTIAIIDRSLTGVLLGFSYHPTDEVMQWDELNIYLFLICIHIKWNEKV
tara:strand:- start:204 stop:350 length:147 start_codon:yes stop_codon:yes gene_type:complete